jgi:DnaJ-class molecular chaperone
MPATKSKEVRAVERALNALRTAVEAARDTAHAGRCPVCDGCGQVEEKLVLMDATCPVCHGVGSVDCGHDDCTEGC